MERFNLHYSVKNIPIPTEKQYKLQLMEKIETFIKRIRWKAFYYELNNNNDEPHEEENTVRETYGLKSPNCPPPIKDLMEFENDLFDIVKKLKFRKVRCEFQNKLRSDIREIKSSNSTLTPADKTSNMYRLPKERYKQILENAVTKSYKKTTTDKFNKINKEGKVFSENANISDRMNINGKNQCFITLKDHKPNFENKLPTRLINPAKNEIGRISKNILQTANTELRNLLQLQQWQNTSTVLEWFNKMENKKQRKFMMFDIKEFYPSIIEKLLRDAISFAISH